jgi:putative ABC transport system permease protein
VNWRLAFNLLLSDWRAGEWRVLLIALLLAVGSMSTVGLFADRVRQALQQESHALLGADLRVTASKPLPQAHRQAALQRGLRAIETASFASMVNGAGGNVLSEILAVEAGYPLRGKVELEIISPSPQPSPLKGEGAMIAAQRGSVSSTQAAGIPSPHTLWADDRLMRKLGLHLGDEVQLGALHLRVTARIVRDVDQAVGFASFAPRAWLNAADLPASGLLQEGSRVSHRLLVAGDVAAVANYRTWLQANLNAGERLEDVRDARPEIRIALERAEHFLGLAALTAVILAGVAMALAARHFIQRHLDACALMRCMGASQAQVLNIFLLQFVWLGLGAVLLGGGLGYAAQSLLVQSLDTMRAAQLPAPSLQPLLQADCSGMALLLGFTFLPLWQLKSVSPLRVIRRELGAPEMTTRWLYALGAAVLAGLFLWQAGSLKLGSMVLGGLLAGMLLFGALAWLALRGLARLPQHAFANLARHARSNALQIVALSLGGMALLLLTFVRADLVQSWQDRLPPDAPNRFITSIQDDQRDALAAFFAQQNLASPKLFPMVRGRLTAINQRTIRADSYPEPRARALVEREFNLSWADALPVENTLVQGAWWTSDAPALSVEEGIAKTLDIHLGDTLTYDVAGTQFTAPVLNLRKVKWDSMQVNFFVIATPKLLQDAPVSYITSFYLSSVQAAFGDLLLKEFSNLLLIDTEAMIEQVRHIMQQITQTLSAVFLFTLLSGLAVLYAALLATQDERIQHAAILRTLGAQSAYLRRLHLTEFATLGALSGLFASAGASVLGWVLARYVLETPYAPSAAMWLIGTLGGMVLVMSSGWLMTRKVAQIPPLRVLQG